LTLINCQAGMSQRQYEKQTDTQCHEPNLHLNPFNDPTLSYLLMDTRQDFITISSRISLRTHALQLFPLDVNVIDMFLNMLSGHCILFVKFQKLLALRSQYVTVPFPLETYQTGFFDLIQTLREKPIVKVGPIHYLSLLRTTTRHMQHVSYYV
jgi:hypothetical protein